MEEPPPPVNHVSCQGNVTLSCFTKMNACTILYVILSILVLKFLNWFLIFECMNYQCGL